MIIEVDGGQHADSSRDAERDSILMARNWSVLRLWNHEVRENLPGVLEKILDACQSRHDI
jgi:BirA family biotin operon repressor/biotin-[acetyl-CoA-carboxylase] ligase